MIANRSSASASEIVTGALQDHDRAILVGETTFGKALVQSVYRISGGAGLALTTAHYYTPSGRLIQRPWDETFDEYQLYTLRDQDIERPHNAERVEAHRRGAARLQRRRHRARQANRGPVGPGKTGGFNVSRFARLLNSRQAFASYAQKYTRRRRRRASASSRPDAGPSSRTSSSTMQMVADFRQQLVTDGVKIDEDGVRSRISRSSRR